MKPEHYIMITNDAEECTTRQRTRKRYRDAYVFYISLGWDEYLQVLTALWRRAVPGK